MAPPPVPGVLRPNNPNAVNSQRYRLGGQIAPRTPQGYRHPIPPQPSADPSRFNRPIGPRGPPGNAQFNPNGRGLPVGAHPNMAQQQYHMQPAYARMQSIRRQHVSIFFTSYKITMT